MFGLGFGELVIIAVLAFILIGPDQLPKALTTAGKVLRQVKAAARDVQGAVDRELQAVEQQLTSAPAAPRPAPPAVAGPAAPAPTPTPTTPAAAPAPQPSPPSAEHA